MEDKEESARNLELKLEFEKLELERQNSKQAFEIEKLRIKWISGVVAIVLALIAAAGGLSAGVFDFLVRQSQSQDNSVELETKLEKEYLDSYIQFALDKDLSVRRDFALYVFKTARTDGVRTNWEAFHRSIVDQIRADEIQIKEHLEDIESLKGNEYRNREKIAYLNERISAISNRIQNVPSSRLQTTDDYKSKAPVEQNKYFYDCIREPLHGGSISQPAVEAYKTIFEYWNINDNYIDKRQLAYILATVRAEVGSNMSPVREGFAATDAAARSRIRHLPYGNPVGPYGHVYYGRGYVLLTWLHNYEKMSKKLGIDLVQFPDLALEPDIAIDILVNGMMDGDFNGHGHGLPFYIGGENEDPVGARRTINVLDRANEIAGFYEQYKVCLN